MDYNIHLLCVVSCLVMLLIQLLWELALLHSLYNCSLCVQVLRIPTMSTEAQVVERAHQELTDIQVQTIWLSRDNKHSLFAYDLYVFICL